MNFIFALFCWLPTAVVSSTASTRTYAVGEETTVGSLVVNFKQMPVPSTTQLMRFSEKGKEWISFTPGSVYLVDFNGSYDEWVPYGGFTGYPTTGFTGKKFKAVSYSNDAGITYDSDRIPPSALNIGFTSYTIQEDMELKENAFFVQTPPWIRYIVPACPNYAVGQSGADACPSRNVTKGEWKFSVLGMISGSAINSLSDSPPVSTKWSAGSEESEHKRKANAIYDIANYKTLVYRTILDVGSMGSSVAASLEYADGSTKVLSDVSSGEDIVNHAITVSGSNLSAEALKITFVKNYATGTFTRNITKVVCTKDESYAQGNTFGKCTRDVTGLSDSDEGYMRGPNFGRATAGTVGDPVLTVTEVKPMKVTVRPATCSGRPADPPWDPQQPDCPWWYNATWNGNKWGGVEEFGGKSFDKENDMKCESGFCYFIDFHVDLGGNTTGSRTAFGNPLNDNITGIEKGTFFVYDPTVDVVGDSDSDDGRLGGAGKIHSVWFAASLGMLMSQWL